MTLALAKFYESQAAQSSGAAPPSLPSSGSSSNLTYLLEPKPSTHTRSISVTQFPPEMKNFNPVIGSSSNGNAAIITTNNNNNVNINSPVTVQQPSKRGGSSTPRKVTSRDNIPPTATHNHCECIGDPHKLKKAFLDLLRNDAEFRGQIKQFMSES
jgi:hypothetical protein